VIARRVVFTVITLICILMPGCSERSLPEKPNILFIFADDQCYETLGILGSEVQTPNLDRLAENGVLFTQAFNMGAWHGAVCVASRTMLNTGRFLWHAESLEPNLAETARAGQLWSQYLGKAGYDTYFSGKWHVKIDAEQIFQTTRDIRPGMPNQTAEGYNRPLEGKPDVWHPWDPRFGGYWQGGKHWSEVLADDAIDFLRQAAKRDGPFFMYLAFNAPHDPRQSPKEYVQKYPLDKIIIPENFLSEYPFKDKIGCGKDLRDERLAPFPRTEYAVRVHRQEYYAIITHMDDQIGRILKALEASGKMDNTYIFFTADHGLAVGHHGLIGKQNMFDHSIRVPLLINGPGIPKGERIETPVYLQDIAPTALELAGVDIPEYFQFKSLMPLISGEKEHSYTAIYGGYMQLQRMVRMDNYKLIYYPQAKKFLLFDLASDPAERVDLADLPMNENIIEGLKKELQKLQAEVGDTLVLPL
jgi:choline-sulfatase